ncbi:hypothetical protein SAMN05421665_2939 [Yoonia rosea]|uniref:Uncharacterized protein n=1 Tax=Yoonia rosea TaxID=287098 RepID=A0A1R3XDP5_9RHOB|nr:hypothetical protein SAMN05421665_2939 [Yoonia rosea]
MPSAFYDTSHNEIGRGQSASVVRSIKGVDKGIKGFWYFPEMRYLLC